MSITLKLIMGVDNHLLVVTNRPFKGLAGGRSLPWDKRVVAPLPKAICIKWRTAFRVALKVIIIFNSF